MISTRELIRQRLARGPLVLDGATGTELERRGAAARLPLWSAAALTERPEVVEAIHRDYVAAGADILVANTFRTNVRTLRQADRLAEGATLNGLAVELARRAACSRRPARGSAAREPSSHRAKTGATGSQPGAADVPVLVAASVAPVEDCYRPDLVPDETVLRHEHRQMAAWLQAVQPDLVWIETISTVREARAAAAAVAAVGLPFAASFVVQESGDLLGGEPLAAAVAAVDPYEPLAVGLNCIPPRGVTAILPRLRRATDCPLSAYAHINNPTPIPGWSFSQALSPREYAEYVRQWLDLGVQIVGGCCGTTPAHIRAIRELI